jgi:hypothetical protein
MVHHRIVFLNLCCPVRRRLRRRFRRRTRSGRRRPSTKPSPGWMPTNWARCNSMAPLRRQPDLRNLASSATAISSERSNAVARLHSVKTKQDCCTLTSAGGGVPGQAEGAGVYDPAHHDATVPGCALCSLVLSAYPTHSRHDRCTSWQVMEHAEAEPDRPHIHAAGGGGGGGGADGGMPGGAPGMLALLSVGVCWRDAQGLGRNQHRQRQPA